MKLFVLGLLAFCSFGNLGMLSAKHHDDIPPCNNESLDEAWNGKEHQSEEHHHHHHH